MNDNIRALYSLYFSKYYQHRPYKIFAIDGAVRKILFGDGSSTYVLGPLINFMWKYAINRK